MSSTHDVDRYISQFDDEVRARLQELCEIIGHEAPQADEGMSYGIIGYKLGGKPLVYIGGFARHIGFYATPNGHEAFKDDFAKYKQGKGSVQFPNDQPLPIDLIKKVVKYRKTQVQ